MRYKLLGRSGLRVSEICLGTMTFGEEGNGASHEESRKLFEAFVEHGGNFIDTANAYAGGISERLIAELVRPERDRFVLATKYTLAMRGNDPNASGNHRKNMVQSLEASLRRLKTDYVDLYWVHAWDFRTPVDEVLRALDDLVRAGKVLYIGISDTPAWVVAQANTIAELRGWSRFIGLQLEYSLIQRTVERDLVPMARAFDIAVVAWGSIGGGVLSGRYCPIPEDLPPPEPRKSDSNQWRLSEKNLRIAAEVCEIALELECTPSQVAINWVRQQPGTIIPIIGARTATQAVENLGCLELELSPQHMNRLTRASHIELGFPYDFLNMEPVRRSVHGDTDRLIDGPRA
jgi:aryl-alcohol dehydrogenase-like predicted oxidoreductase